MCKTHFHVHLIFVLKRKYDTVYIAKVTITFRLSMGNFRSWVPYLGKSVRATMQSDCTQVSLTGRAQGRSKGKYIGVGLE